MTGSNLLAFAGTALLIELTPGPNMGYLAVVALSHGRGKALAVVAGVATGLLVVGLAAAMGVVSLLEHSRLAYETLRFGGAAYLLWLAWEGWRDADKPLSASVADDDTGFGAYFRRGLITNLLNPKAALFYIATLPQFLPRPPALLSAGWPDAEVVNSLWLTLIYVAIATLIHLGIVLSSARLHDVFSTPQRLKPLQRAMALALAAIALWLVVSTAR